MTQRMNYKPKAINYDTYLNMRVSSDMIETLKQMAEERNTSYQKLARGLLEQYTKQYKENKNREENLRKMYMSD